MFGKNKQKEKYNNLKKIFDEEHSKLRKLEKQIWEYERKNSKLMAKNNDLEIKNTTDFLSKIVQLHPEIKYVIQNAKISTTKYDYSMNDNTKKGKLIVSIDLETIQ